jgi:hypothetical protein
MAFDFSQTFNKYSFCVNKHSFASTMLGGVTVKSPLCGRRIVKHKPVQDCDRHESHLGKGRHWRASRLKKGEVLGRLPEQMDVRLI